MVMNKTLLFLIASLLISFVIAVATGGKALVLFLFVPLFLP